MPTLFAYGDSWTEADIHNTPGQRAVVQLASRMGWTLSNFARTSDYIGDVGTIASDGYRSNGVGRYDPADSDFVLFHAGANDLKNADTTQVRTAILHYLRHGLALFSAAERIEDSTFTASGTWSNNSGNWSPSAGVNRSSTGAGASLTATISTAGRYHLVTFGARGSTVGAEITVTKGGSTLATIVTDEVVTALNSHTNNVGPMATDLGTLTTGDVVITRTGSTGTAFVDCLVRQSATPPKILLVKPVEVLHASYQNATLLAYIRDTMDDVAAEFGSHVIVVDPAPGWNTATMLGADGLHPNDAGMTHLADAMEAALAGNEVTLAGTLQGKTAAFTVATVLAASLAGTLQAKTAEFNLELPAAPDRTVSLSAELPRKTSTFTVLGAVDATLAGTLQPKTAAFTVLGNGTLTLAGELRPKSASLTLESGKTLTLSASLRRKASAVTLVGSPIVSLAAALRRRVGAFEVTAVPSVALDGLLQPKIATFLTRAVTPVTPAPDRVDAAMSVVVARAFGPVAMQHGTQPVYTVSKAEIPRARQQIVVDGVDISYFRGVTTPDVTYTLLEPLLYGPGRLELPQVVAWAETFGAGDLAWLRAQAPIEVHLVIDDVVVIENVYKGFIAAFDPSGANLSVELGGEANGRMATRDRHNPIFPRINDIGHQMADGVRDVGMPHHPPLGAVTGIETMTTGGTGHLDWFNGLVAKSWTRSGKQWTCMPDPDTGVYETHRKDAETIHATAFIDDAKTVANLRRDIAEEPNQIFVTCVTPAGMRVRFGKYPGLVQGPVPDFPGNMTIGSTGEGVRLLVGKLHASGYLKLVDVAGGYDEDVDAAVRQLQEDAGLPETGDVNLATWRALYDLDVTGLSLEWANIQPAAQRSKTRKFDRSANGTIMGFNDEYDPEVIVRHRTIDLGAGVTRSQAREFARTVLHDSDAPNWIGDITFHTGALIRGEGAIGMTVTPDDVMDARELRPGMNVLLPGFDDGTLLHVSACEVKESGLVTATVDTRFRDAMEVWEVIARNKESRNDPSRHRERRYRASTIVKDSIGEWDEFGGMLGVDLPLEPGWNKFPVVAAMEGQIRELKIRLASPAEFVVAVWGQEPDVGWLNETIPHPLTVSGTKVWETKQDELEDRLLLYSAGTHDEPCGYWPGRKTWESVTGEEVNPDYNPGADENTTGTDDAETIEVTTSESSGTLTGKHVDAAGFPYFAADRKVVWVTAWVRSANKIEAQRIMKPQLEAGV